MKLEQQICSLELAQKLKKLGVKQESLWYWCNLYEKSLEIITEKDKPSILNKDIYYQKFEFSAFTVAELGGILPYQFFSRCFSGYRINSQTYEKEAYCDFSISNMEKRIYADTEANVRAEMLIYLIENKIIK